MGLIPMIGKSKMKKGFSLIEMLVVVTIVGILATAAVPVAEISFVSLKESELNDNLATIRQAIQTWRKDCQIAAERQVGSKAAIFDAPDALMYPPSIFDLAKPKASGYTFSWTAHLLPGEPTETVTFYPHPYLTFIPKDPFVGSPIWTEYFASGAATITYYAPGNEPTPALCSGVFDISPVASTTLRHGFIQAVDGTYYANW